MLKGLSSITAAVVIRRRRPSCVRRENAMAPPSSSHQRLATAAWACSGVASASQTFISGKLNEFISLFVGDRNAPSRRPDQRRIEAQPPLRPRRFAFFHGVLDGCKNELASGTALAGGSLVQPAMEVAGNVDRSPDGCWLH